jgi:hypothetical protein
MCSAVLPMVERFGLIRIGHRNAVVDVPPQFLSEGAATRAMRNQRVKGVETDANQGCAATDGGAIRTDTGSGDPEVDGAARNAGDLGDRPLIVLTAGQYWRPNDPVAAQQIEQFHQTWVNQLQPELAHLSTNGKQVIVENSDHGIPDEAPEAVVTAVQEVVTGVRKRQNQ